MPKHNNEWDWEFVKTQLFPRSLALISAIVLWVISIIYSTDGFGYYAGSPHAWMGTIIAIFGVTTLEIIFNNGHHQGNQTVTALCMVAYAYGVGSNIVGIWSDWGAPGWGDGRLIGTIIGAVMLGFNVEVAPEVLLNVALGINGGLDFINQLAGVIQAPSMGNYKPRKRKPAIMTETGVVRNAMACPECGSMNTLVANDRLFCNACHHQEMAGA
jgi:hypothetical protein